MDKTVCFKNHNCAGALSVSVVVVVFARSVSCKRTMLCPSTPASLRSNSVMAPSGFSHETSCITISRGSLKHHRVGSMSIDSPTLTAHGSLSKVSPPLATECVDHGSSSKIGSRGCPPRGQEHWRPAPFYLCLGMGQGLCQARPCTGLGC